MRGRFGSPHQLLLVDWKGRVISTIVSQLTHTPLPPARPFSLIRWTARHTGCNAALLQAIINDKDARPSPKAFSLPICLVLHCRLQLNVGVLNIFLTLILIIISLHRYPAIHLPHSLRTCRPRKEPSPAPTVLSAPMPTLTKTGQRFRTLPSDVESKTALLSATIVSLPSTERSLSWLDSLVVLAQHVTD